MAPPKPYQLLDAWLAPLTSRYFPDHAGGQLDHQHGFVVDYAETGDTSLDFHVDDSEVTQMAPDSHIGAGAVEMVS
jgi:hypothetical protein